MTLSHGLALTRSLLERTKGVNGYVGVEASYKSAVYFYPLCLKNQKGVIGFIL